MTFSYDSLANNAPVNPKTAGMMYASEAGDAGVAGNENDVVDTPGISTSNSYVFPLYFLTARGIDSTPFSSDLK